MDDPAGKMVQRSPKKGAEDSPALTIKEQQEDVDKTRRLDLSPRPTLSQQLMRRELDEIQGKIDEMEAQATQANLLADRIPGVHGRVQRGKAASAT